MLPRLNRFAAQFVRDERGQEVLEYVMLATFVCMLVLVGASVIGTALDRWHGK